MTALSGIVGLVTWTTRMPEAPRGALLFDIHLVVPVRHGNPVTLCGDVIDLASRDQCDDQVVSAGLDSPGSIRMRCVECTEVAFTHYPNVRIGGLAPLAGLFREALEAYASMFVVVEEEE